MHVPLSTSDFRSASGQMNAMEVNKNKTAKLFHMMSSTLYTDKFMSILRELASNARDSHQEAGKLDTPFTIIAPSANHTQLIVSDAGTGITYERAQRTILEFLSSTKDGEDGDEQLAIESIGGWGIGAKTPRAYADNYQVHLRKDGTEWIVQVVNNSAGLPMETLMDERPTHRPDGVDFVIPIQPIHVNQWREKIKTYVARTNYNVMAYMGNGEVLTSSAPYRSYDFDFFSLDAHGTPSYGTSDRHTVEVVYGGMVYQIPHEFACAQLQSDICKMVKKGLTLTIRLDKANAIKCGLSREHMEVDEANKNLILKALLLIEEDLKVATSSKAFERSGGYFQRWSEIKAISDKLAAQIKENAAMSRLSAISSSKSYEVTWAPGGLLEDWAGRDKMKSCTHRLTLPLEDDYVPTVRVLYGPKPLLRWDVYHATGSVNKLECPILTDDEAVARKWAEELPHYEGCKLVYEEVESTKVARVASGSKGPRLSYVICDVTRKRHNLVEGQPLLAVPSASFMWLGKLTEFTAFVPTKSLKYRQLPDDSVVMMEDYVKTEDYKRALKYLAGATLDKSMMFTIAKSLEGIGIQQGPEKVLEWAEDVREKLTHIATKVNRAKDMLASLKSEYGDQKIPTVPLEGIDEVLKESNRLYVFLERNRDLFNVIDFERLERQLKAGNPEAMRLMYAMNLGQFQ